VNLPDDLPTLWSARVAEAMRRHALPGVAMAVAHRGQPVWSDGFGSADVDRRREVRADTVFRLASITKLFTAVAVLVLRDEGRLDLDDPVAKHVGEFPGERVRLRELLSHGGGIQRETPEDPGWVTGRFLVGEAFLEAVRSTRSPFSPMERWKYSNLGYSLLGEVVARVSGRPYIEFVTERIIGPLGLGSTAFDPATLPRERLATGYRRLPDTDAMEVDAGDGRDPVPAAAGQLFSTVLDLCAFAGFLGGDRAGPVGSETLAEMRRPQLLADEEWTKGHGLGPMLVRDDTRVLVGHAGGLFGYAGWLLFWPRSHVAAVALTNVGDGEPLLPLVKRAIAEASEHVAEEPEPTTAPPPEIRDLLGRYFGDGFELHLEWRGGRLVGTEPIREGLPVEPPMPLEPDGEDRWRFVDGGPYVGEALTLERDDAGRIRAFEVCTYRFERLS
jgi:CubicO group peptidase (beta-lactamase class C family)